MISKQSAANKQADNILMLSRGYQKIAWSTSIHNGRTTASSKSLFASLNPATSSHLTPGLESKTSLSSIAAKSASGPSYSTFLAFPSSLSPFYLLVVVSRLGGGLQTSGSSIGPDEVGYSSSGWKTKDDDLVEIGGENGRLPT
nr:hypothetical protein CR513_36902 [Ipomoea batatas]